MIETSSPPANDSDNYIGLSYTMYLVKGEHVLTFKFKFKFLKSNLFLPSPPTYYRRLLNPP